ncbi:hypothetical protein EI94DRAFT_1707105 [Lactarius quietus]|nr:hypothetical protein EI94DRAFT_1707105 [Lactarius quietus]
MLMHSTWAHESGNDEGAWRRSMNGGRIRDHLGTTLRPGLGKAVGCAPWYWGAEAVLWMEARYDLTGECFRMGNEAAREIITAQNRSRHRYSPFGSPRVQTEGDLTESTELKGRTNSNFLPKMGAKGTSPRKCGAGIYRRQCIQVPFHGIVACAAILQVLTNDISSSGIPLFRRGAIRETPANDQPANGIDSLSNARAMRSLRVAKREEDRGDRPTDLGRRFAANEGRPLQKKVTLPRDRMSPVEHAANIMKKGRGGVKCQDVVAAALFPTIEAIDVQTLSSGCASGAYSAKSETLSHLCCAPPASSTVFLLDYHSGYSPGKPKGGDVFACFTLRISEVLEAMTWGGS